MKLGICTVARTKITQGYNCSKIIKNKIYNRFILNTEKGGSCNLHDY